MNFIPQNTFQLHCSPALKGPANIVSVIAPLTQVWVLMRTGLEINLSWLSKNDTTGHFKRRLVLGIIVSLLLTMVISKETRAVIIALHKNGLTGKRVSQLERLHLSRQRFHCCQKGSRAPKKDQQAPGPSLKSVSAAGSGYQQCRACSGMAAGRCECICTHCEAETLGARPGLKEGSKEATSLQKKHQGQTDILQKVQGVDCWGLG